LVELSSHTHLEEQNEDIQQAVHYLVTKMKASSSANQPNTELNLVLNNIQSYEIPQENQRESVLNNNEIDWNISKESETSSLLNSIESEMNAVLYNSLSNVSSLIGIKNIVPNQIQEVSFNGSSQLLKGRGFEMQSPDQTLYNKHSLNNEDDSRHFSPSKLMDKKDVNDGKKIKKPNKLSIAVIKPK
jgi:hypothetical protein